MGHLERSLAPEEKLLIHRHPHVKTLIKPIAASILITAVAAVAYVLITATSLAGTGLAILGGLLGLVWAVGIVYLLVVPLLKWGTTHFAVTDRRIVFRHGIVTKTGIDIPIARINSVQFRHDFVDRLFKTGTLIVESASDEPLEFNDIPQVEKVHSLLYDELNDVLTDDEGNAK